jgi:drug/metabolite transporter (DMT)-like permease|tara:strand:+ start:444 stop:1286 length:843 start_codon:yes stop_codon:yes gene_type:complete
MTSASIYFLIFFAAFLHALWNIIIKSLDYSLAGIAVKVFFQSIIFFPIIFFVPFPEGITWFYITCSFLLHSLYFILLGSMYDRKDLTFIYPVARGCAPIFVTILSFIFLKDIIPFFGLVGILIICVALLLISFSNFNTKVDFKTIGISIFIAFLISIYTFSDGAGVRSVDNSLSFIVWNFFLGGWISIGYVYLTKREDLFSLKIKDLILILSATIVSFTAYAIIIWSMKYEPFGIVASMRESSIIFAPLLGLIFLKEKISPIRIISSILFFLGVVFIFNA